MTNPQAAELAVPTAPTLLAHAQAAATITAQWADEIGGTTVHTPVGDLPAERLDKTARWALYAPTKIAEKVESPSADTTLSRLAGSAKRMVFDASRDTVVQNAVHGKFARYASANACAFCRLQATRGAVFNSARTATIVVGKRSGPRGSRAVGEKWHDHCRCIAVPVPPGETYEPPDYTKQWQADYEAARSDVSDAHQRQTIQNILAAMRANTDAR
jgi:hypothetical protein